MYDVVSPALSKVDLQTLHAVMMTTSLLPLPLSDMKDHRPNPYGSIPLESSLDTQRSVNTWSVPPLWHGLENGSGCCEC